MHERPARSTWATRVGELESLGRARSAQRRVGIALLGDVGDVETAVPSVSPAPEETVFTDTQFISRRAVMPTICPVRGLPLLT